MTQSDLVGQRIKRGRSGLAPKILGVVWAGTAEVDCPRFGYQRLPAALVLTDKGDAAVIQLAGSDFESNRWWDGRIFYSREWESADGQMVQDTDQRVAERIGAYLATATTEHDSARVELSQRVLEGKYSYTKGSSTACRRQSRHGA